MIVHTVETSLNTTCHRMHHNQSKQVEPTLITKHSRNFFQKIFVIFSGSISLAWRIPINTRLRTHQIVNFHTWTGKHKLEKETTKEKIQQQQKDNSK